MSHYNHNQTRTCFPTDIIWSAMTFNGSDWPLQRKLNYHLNGLLVNCETCYNLNGYTYAIRKVDPYTAIETNNITGQQRTLKSSVCTLNIFAL